MTELKSFKSSSSNRIKGLQASPSISLKLPSSTRLQSFSNNEFTNNLDVKTNSSVAIASYSLADLQTATGNFATGRLLGEGSIGRVYRAKYADGRVSNTILSAHKLQYDFFLVYPLLVFFDSCFLWRMNISPSGIFIMRRGRGWGSRVI